MAIPWNLDIGPIRAANQGEYTEVADKPAHIAPQATSEGDLPTADATLEAPGANCAVLTPLIKTKLRDLDSGQIVEVLSDDPKAREAVPAWSRLTGNPLIATVEEDAEGIRFYLRKK